MKTLLPGLAASIALPALALGALTVLIARKATRPGRRATVAYRLGAGGQIRLERTADTERPGAYGLWPETGHIRVGEILDDTRPGEVVRRALGTTGAPARTGRGRWSGHLFADARSLGLPVEDAVIARPAGPRPAWVFPGSNALWAIHVHGIHSSRASALRSVPVFSRLGATSLVPSYVGDAENQNPQNSVPATFGQDEAADIEAAIEFAVRHGAQGIVLVGWSMGGTISLRLAEGSPHRDAIAGIVLISAAAAIPPILEAGVERHGIPGWIGRLVPPLLSSRPGSRLAGLPGPIDFDALDWTRPRATLPAPVLVIHSPGDQDVPFALTQRFMRAQGANASLEEFPPVPHQLEYNTDPARFEAAISDWLARIPAARGLPDGPPRARAES